MYTNLEAFIDDWKYESESTVKIFKNLTDASLSQYVYDEGRTLGFIARHIVDTIPEMMGKAGLSLGEPKGEVDNDTVESLVKDYEELSAKFVEELRAKWNDNTLQEDVEMYGSVWKKGAAITAFAYHQCHHRGQMTVLMRQAGLKVPGIYGPSKEEWTAYGMEPMK